MERWRVKKYSGEYDFNPEEHYEFRKEVEMKDLTRLLNEGRIDQERVDAVMLRERENYLANIEEMKDQEKMNKDTAIIVPAYWGHKPWMKACLESCKKLGFYTLISYDNHFRRHARGSGMFPTHDVMMLADSFVMKHVTEYSSVGISHMYNVWYGLKLLQGFGFKYILNIEGDHFYQKPEGFPELVELLGDYDVIPTHWEEGRGFAAVLGLAKTEVYVDFFEHFVRTQHDFSGNSEGRFYKFLKGSKYKAAPIRNSVDNYYMPDPNCDWTRIMGLRHLHAEQRIRQESRYFPVEREYFDYGEGNENIGAGGLFQYYETGDVKHLEDNWWGWEL